MSGKKIIEYAKMENTPETPREVTTRVAERAARVRRLGSRHTVHKPTSARHDAIRAKQKQVRVHHSGVARDKLGLKRSWACNSVKVGLEDSGCCPSCREREPC